MLPLRSVGRSNFDKGLHNLTTLIQKTTYTNENCCITYIYMTDTTVINLITFAKLRVAKFTSSLKQSYDLRDIRLKQKEALLEQKYCTESMPLLTNNHRFQTCGGPEAFNP